MIHTYQVCENIIIFCLQCNFFLWSNKKHFLNKKNCWRQFNLPICSKMWLHTDWLSAEWCTQIDGGIFHSWFFFIFRLTTAVTAAFVIIFEHARFKTNWSRITRQNTRHGIIGTEFGSKAFGILPLMPILLHSISTFSSLRRFHF